MAKKIFVGNLSYKLNDDDLVALFRPFGDIIAAHIVLDRDTNRPRGFGFVEFKSEKATASAVSTLNGREVDGRKLIVNIARLMDPNRFRHSKFNEFAEPDADDMDILVESETGCIGVLAELACPASIIRVSSRINDQLLDFLAKHPNELKTDRIDSLLFEEIIAELWGRFGYDVELTKKSHDGGIDIIAVRHHVVHERFLIQCKKPSKRKVVGISPVRELYGVKNDNRATKGILATTAHFTQSARIFFEDHKWELDGKDFDGVCEWLRMYEELKTMQ